MTPAPIHQGPSQRLTNLSAVLTALVAVALILVAKTIPAATAQGPVITSTDHDIPTPVVAMASAHLGIHSGGMVLTERPVGEVVSIEHARMDKRTSFGTPERLSA